MYDCQRRIPSSACWPKGRNLPVREMDSPTATSVLLHIGFVALFLMRRGLVETFSRLPVRAVDVGDISLHCLPNRLFATTRRVRAVAQSVSSTTRPVRQALVEMDSSGYAVSAPRRARRESPGIV